MIRNQAAIPNIVTGIKIVYSPYLPLVKTRREANVKAHLGAAIAAVIDDQIGGWNPVEESAYAHSDGYYSEYIPRNYQQILGNEGLADGLAYLGRGQIQITGKQNYARILAMMVKKMETGTLITRASPAVLMVLKSRIADLRLIAGPYLYGIKHLDNSDVVYELIKGKKVCRPQSGSNLLKVMNALKEAFMDPIFCALSTSIFYENASRLTIRLDMTDHWADPESIYRFIIGMTGYNLQEGPGYSLDDGTIQQKHGMEIIQNGVQVFYPLLSVK